MAAGVIKYKRHFGLLKYLNDFVSLNNSLLYLQEILKYKILSLNIFFKTVNVLYFIILCFVHCD